MRETPASPDVSTQEAAWFGTLRTNAASVKEFRISGALLVLVGVYDLSADFYLLQIFVGF
jgi:hypothetical protein